MPVGSYQAVYRRIHAVIFGLFPARLFQFSFWFTSFVGYYVENYSFFLQFDLFIIYFSLW